MQDSSFNAYNTVFNKLKQDANQYYALSVAYEKSKLFGFSDFARNESEERWDYSECIRRYLAINDRKVMIAAMPEPIQDFETPRIGLEKGLEFDKIILNAINATISTVEPGEIVYMTKIRDIMQGQVNEVGDYIAKMGFQGGTVYEIDELLYEKFGQEYESNPCHK